MAEQVSPPSDRPGDPSQRKAKISTTAVYGYSTGIAIATAHYLVKCWHAGGQGSPGYWVFFPPDDSLIEMWTFVLLPTVHLLARIVGNHLHKLAGDQE